MLFLLLRLLLLFRLLRLLSLRLRLVVLLTTPFAAVLFVFFVVVVDVL